MNANLPLDWHEHDLAFHFDTGRVCLDFLATIGDRAHEAFDRWRTPDDLAAWLVGAGLAERSPKLDADALRDARRLREAVYRFARCRLSGEPPRKRDIGEINACAAEAPPAPRLAPDGKCRNPHAWTGLGAVLSCVARDAIDLFTGGEELGRLRECAEATCSVLFIDTSRPGRRRWCSMERCGNRAKKRAYRARQGRRR